MYLAVFVQGQGSMNITAVKPGVFGGCPLSLLSAVLLPKQFIKCMKQLPVHSCGFLSAKVTTVNNFRPFWFLKSLIQWQ